MIPVGVQYSYTDAVLMRQRASVGRQHYRFCLLGANFRTEFQSNGT